MKPETVKAILKQFNAQPKTAVAEFKAFCQNENLDFANEMARFFYQHQHNLDLEAVGDYLSGPEEDHQAVLQKFTDQMDFQDHFLESLRYFLKTFKLPGEAQKIDRLIKSFAECYSKKSTLLLSPDAIYVLAFMVVILNTDLHHPRIAHHKKMSFQQLKSNLSRCHNNNNFDEEFLWQLYNDIKRKPLELNFVKIPPGYVIAFNRYHPDAAFILLDEFFQNVNAKAMTKDIPNFWLRCLLGYVGTITFTGDNNIHLATIQVYQPGFFFSFFGVQTRIIIQPAQESGAEAIECAAKLAACFQSPVNSIKATYDYEKEDLESAYQSMLRALTAGNVSPSK